MLPSAALCDSLIKVNLEVLCGRKDELSDVLLFLACLWCSSDVDSMWRKLSVWGALFLSKSVLMQQQMNGRES